MEEKSHLIYSVYERMENMEKGETIPVTGHKGHWYTQKAKLKKRYPDRKFKIYNFDGKYFCIRKS